MQSLWNDSEAKQFGADLLGLRVYSSRLLGREPSLVLHGGGNTSLKSTVTNMFGEVDEVLYVKGSGWDLATIEPAGFAPTRLKVLRQLAQLESIADRELVRVQRSALTTPDAPEPSVEAVLHAIIPSVYVDHTHADAVVALTNSPDGADRIREALGSRVIFVPYVMPGFPLARRVYELTRDIDWSRFDGMVLLNHGLFTWGDTARDSYEAMIRLVTAAERYLEENGAFNAVRTARAGTEDLQTLARVRRAVSDVAGHAVLARVNRAAEACGFAELDNAREIAARGPLTPDHVIRTKAVPVVLGPDPAADIKDYAKRYREYFERHSNRAQTMLDPAPRWAVWPGQGVIAFGRTIKDVGIVSDICERTIAAIQWAEALGGWRPLPEDALFAVEYWELEQAKLAKSAAARPFQGRVSLVTGAASGIGKAVAAELASQGSAVVGVDIEWRDDASSHPGITAVTLDLTDSATPQSAADEAVRRFGGLDFVVSNVGVFPGSQTIEQLDAAAWERALDLNLTSHQRLLKACIPYLKHGVEPAVILVGSKNVPAPGPGQAAYSVSKAGLAQLGRVAALELATAGIRVNIVHPNAVFDTGIWTEEVLAQRAAAYKMEVGEYKRNNLLGVEVTSKKVAASIVALLGPAFSCTTGASIPIDGGNDRVV